MARVTLREVAAASGVSRATASFVLNDRQDQTISAATRERVLTAARDLGYVPNGIARALVEGSSRIVVLIDDSRLAGNYMASFIRGFDRELVANGHMLLVRRGSADAGAEQMLLDTISPRAIYRVGAAYRSGHELEDAGGGWRDGLAAHAALQLRHLAEHGHRRVVMALPDRPSLLADARLRFAATTAAELEMSPPRSLVIPADRAAAGEVLSVFVSARPKITAVAALDDEVALTVLAAMHDLGLTAPDDLAVIGYDDTPYGAFSVPALTTVHIDAEAHGRIEARLTLRLDTSDIQPVPGRILARASV